jgi:hypothetical protein
MEARCQCGGVRFTTPLPEPIKVYICHCTECRHQSSSLCGISAVFPWFELPIDKQATIATYKRVTKSGKLLECLYCSTCGARLIHRFPGRNTLNVKGGCLVNLSKDMVFNASHIWTKEAVMDIPAGAKQWEEEPQE